MKKFIKNDKQKKVIIASIIGIFVVIVTVSFFTSFASFTTTKEFNVIQGKIPRSKKGDVVFAVLLGDEKVTKIPKKGTGFKYVVRDDACTNGAQVEWNEDRWAPLVVNLSETGTVCTLKFDSIYNSITVDGTVVKEFPDKGDYQVNMGCSNVGSASWDFNAWQPSISGITTNSSCNVVFKSTNSVITKITLDGNTIDKYPAKDNLFSEVVCTNGSIGTWDEVNWKPIINNVTNNTTCTVNFTTKPPIKIGTYFKIDDIQTTVTCKNALKTIWKVVKINGDDTFIIEVTEPYKSGFNMAGEQCDEFDNCMKSKKGYVSSMCSSESACTHGQNPTLTIKERYSAYGFRGCDGYTANVASFTYIFYPVMTLSQNFTVESGSGTQADPYVYKAL